MGECKVKGCERASLTRGWCSAHYSRVIRNGDDGAEIPLLGVALTPQQRLDAKSTIVPFCGCQLWFGASVPSGYGVSHYEGRQQYAHRVAWQLKHGPIPDGLLVLHVCDMPACINVNHLFLGTDADNMADKMAKGRWKGGAPKGDRNPMYGRRGVNTGERSTNHKLTQKQVDEIRSTYKRGVTRQVDIAERFGINQAHVSSIIRGVVWP